MINIASEHELSTHDFYGIVAPATGRTNPRTPLRNETFSPDVLLTVKDACEPLGWSALMSREEGIARSCRQLQPRAAGEKAT